MRTCFCNFVHTSYWKQISLIWRLHNFPSIFPEIPSFAPTKQKKTKENGSPNANDLFAARSPASAALIRHPADAFLIGIRVRWKLQRRTTCYQLRARKVHFWLRQWQQWRQRGICERRRRHLHRRSLPNRTPATVRWDWICPFYIYLLKVVLRFAEIYLINKYTEYSAK